MKHIDNKNKETFFKDNNVEDGDTITYQKGMSISKIRRLASNHRLDVDVCTCTSCDKKPMLLVFDKEYLKEEGAFKEMTCEEEFEFLEPGDRVYRFTDGNCRGLRVVGRMPGARNYLVFSDGEHLEHLYIPNFEKNRWFKGKYDSKITGKVITEYLEKEIELVKEIYIDK